MVHGTRHRFAVAVVVVVATFGVTLVDPGLATAADDYTRAKVKAAGISLEYPSGWTVYALSKREVAAQQKALTKANPELADAFDAAQQSSFTKNTKFHATDLDSMAERGVGGNLGVTNAGVGILPPTLDSFTRQISPQFSSVGGTVIGTSTHKVGGRPAYRVDVRLPLTAPDGTNLTIHVTELFVQVGTLTSMVTLAIDDDAEGAETTDRIMDSVKALSHRG
ncbi:MAG: hypothetical protein ABW033_01395 [Acidimicrobiia bacterium]